MKRLVFKKWVEYLLGIMTFIALLFMGSECADTKLFIVSHLIAFIVAITCMGLLIKFGRTEDEL